VATSDDGGARHPPPPYFFDDLHEGQEFISPARTLTEADVVAFAGLSGDYNPLHTDAEFARGTQYGQRVVHGIFGLAVVTGLTERMGLFSGSAIAGLGVEDWRYTAPIFFGDTIHFDMTITALRPSKQPDRGVAERRVRLVKQDGTVVQEGTMRVLLRRRSVVDDDSNGTSHIS
jgi:acyl dehydratase